VITPSHSSPEHEYNAPNGGPADTDVTGWIEGRANQLLRTGNAGVKRRPLTDAFSTASTNEEDFVMPYVRDLKNALNMEAIREGGLKLAVFLAAPPSPTGSQSTRSIACPPGIFNGWAI